MRHTRKTLLILAVTAVVALGGCKKEDDVNPGIILNAVEKKLSFGDTYQIEATSVSSITYASENEYHATVSGAGLVTARFVGETNITLTNDVESKKVKITVAPKSTLYPTPNVEFGISKNDLIAKLGRPDQETTTGIGYLNNSGVTSLAMYFFDENNKLKQAGVAVSTAYSNELGTYLSERYLLIDEENLLFVNAIDPKKVSMVMIVSQYENVWLVAYNPYTPQSNSSTLKRSIKFSMFDELIKGYR